MFWDRISSLYDLFETVYNGKVYRGTGEEVARLLVPTDHVLECACGTGAISIAIARRCARLLATDFSDGMLRRAERKLKGFDHVRVEKADICNLPYPNGCFDAAVAGNVVHLLSEPEKALSELKRVTKPGGLIILPTYINMSKGSSVVAVKFIEMLGASFKQQFDLEGYRIFLTASGFPPNEIRVVEGRMPCAVAVIRT